MKLVKSNIISLVLILIIVCVLFAFCNKNELVSDSSDPTSSTKGKNGDVYLNTSNYDLYKMQNNKWIKIGNIKGEKGDKGDKGETGKDGITSTIEISNDGYWVINGKKTNTRAEGRDGKDGVSPLISISEEGYWVINGIKTAVKAKAQDGSNGTDGKDGKDGQDGVNGKDGKTPVIEFSEDGYWVINGVKTKIKAKGEDGKTPIIEISEDGYWIVDGAKTTLTISEDGYWVYNGTKTKIKVYEKTLATICKYQNNGVAEKTSGALYSCEVKPGTSYNFYVLTTPTEGSPTINLIMDKNICEDGTPTDANKEEKCLVAYNLDGDAAGVGPVTAMTYLNNATSTWVNIDNLNLTYDDEGKNFTGFTLNGKARLPYYSEITNFNNNNIYLFENLDGGSWNYDQSTKPKNNISGIMGYWALSSVAGRSRYAWTETYLGITYKNYAHLDSHFGVRPVITLKM